MILCILFFPSVWGWIKQTRHLSHRRRSMPLCASILILPKLPGRGVRKPYFEPLPCISLSLQQNAVPCPTGVVPHWNTIYIVTIFWYRLKSTSRPSHKSDTVSNVLISTWTQNFKCTTINCCLRINLELGRNSLSLFGSGAQVELCLSSQCWFKPVSETNQLDPAVTDVIFTLQPPGSILQKNPGDQTHI